VCVCVCARARMHVRVRVHVCVQVVWMLICTLCVCGCTSVYSNAKNGGFKGRGVRKTRGEMSYGTEMVSSETITGAVLTARRTIGAFVTSISFLRDVESAMELGNVTVALCGCSPLPLGQPPLPLTFAPELSCGFPGAGFVARCE